MKQPVLFISQTPPAAYPSILSHYEWIPVHGPEPLTYERLSALWCQYQPLAVFTHGKWDWSALCKTYKVRRRWVHLPDVLPADVVVQTTVFAAVLGRDMDRNHPILSVITTTYKSGDKIQRPMRSLQWQTYADWEWIIWDDSPAGDDDTYNRLLELERSDLRIQVYRAPRPSGVIGRMKHRAAAFAQGDYIVELDHDDDIHPQLFQWIVDAGRKHPEADFFYTDCAELVEEIYTPAGYGDFFCFGYSAHYNTWSDLHGRYVWATYATPPNPKTLSHIVGVPNHVRVWRQEFYERIGKHNTELAVADDYELLLRSWIHGKWCHIRACAYYQYRNRDGNFTFIRNALIQHNVYHIYVHYAGQLPAPRHTDGARPGWMFDGEDYPANHVTYDPAPYENSIVVVDPATSEPITRALASAGPNDRVIVMGDGIEALIGGLDVSAKRRIDWWTITREHTVEDSVRYARKYIHRGANMCVQANYA